MMVERLKHEGTSHSSSDLLKICVKMGASWSAQDLRQAGDTPSGPGAFLQGLVLSCPVLSCLVLSCLVLSCLICRSGIPEKIRYSGLVRFNFKETSSITFDKLWENQCFFEVLCFYVLLTKNSKL